MNLKFLLSIFFLCSICFTTIPQQHNGINGQWISAHPEKTASGNFGIREFGFYKDNWELKFTLYKNNRLTEPLFTFRTAGKFKLAETAGDPTIYNALFQFDRKFLTIKTKDLSVLEAIGLDRCGLEFEKEKDITETGCGYLLSKKICGQEYDLVSLKAGTLFLGTRPVSGGMCTEDKRPLTLGYPLKKIHK